MVHMPWHFLPLPQWYGTKDHYAFPMECGQELRQPLPTNQSWYSRWNLSAILPLEEIRISEASELWSWPVFSRWAEPPARNLTPVIALHHPHIPKGLRGDICNRFPMAWVCQTEEVQLLVMTPSQARWLRKAKFILNYHKVLKYWT